MYRQQVIYGLRPPSRWSANGSGSVDNNKIISEYLDWKASYTTAAASSYKPWVQRFQEFTNKAPEDLTIGDWTAFALSLHGRFAPKCVEFALNIIHNYLRFWHEQGRLRIPLYLARVPKAIAKSHQAITEMEYQRIVAVLKEGKKYRDLALVMLLHDTGVRVGELVKLEVEQMEEDSSAIIRTEKTVTLRKIFWNQDTDDVLHQYIVERISDHPVSDWLFAGSFGTGERPLTTRSVQRVITEACRKAGIERHLSPHSFRHAFIHRLAALGIPDAIIAQLVGHGSPHTIAHYTKLSRPEAEEFARRQFTIDALRGNASRRSDFGPESQFDELALSA